MPALRELKLFMSVYVDLGGKKENMGPMWPMLKKHIDSDPPTAMVDKQYLGSVQREINPDPVHVEKMGAPFEKFQVRKIHQQ